MISSTSGTPVSTTTTAAGRLPRGRHLAMLSMLAGGLLAGSGAIASTIATAPPLEPTVTFDFDAPTKTLAGMQMTTTLGATSGNGLGKMASPNAISAYMTAVLQAANYKTASVTVTGALGTATYTGENHVWGDTLGTTDGGVRPLTTKTDGFLINDNFGIFGKASSEIMMTFTNFVVDSISYDWEIFPDVTCPNSSCKTLPDMSLTANGKLVSGGSFTANRNYSGPARTGTYAPQAMGSITTPLMLNGASLLEFHDWPAEIGIDHLKITGHVVPEPASLPLLGTGLLALGWLARRRRQG